MSAVITGDQNGTVGLINAGTAVASTSGTSIDFTGIPVGVKRITVMFKGVSTSGTSGLQLRLGYSGGVEATGYVGSSGTTADSTGFELNGGSSAAAATYSGVVVVCLQDSSSNTWAESGILGRADGIATLISGGYKSLSGTLDRVRVTTAGGTDTFDAGSINILYE